MTKNKLGSISCALFWRFRGFLSETIGPEFPRSFERRGFYRCDETARSYQIFVVYSRRTTEMSSSDKYATRFLLLCAFFHRKSTAESHFNFFFKRDFSRLPRSKIDPATLKRRRSDKNFTQNRQLYTTMLILLMIISHKQKHIRKI